MPEKLDVSSIPQRIPALNNETAFDAPTIEQQWKTLSSFIRRELINNPDIRTILKTFSTKPVSESMPIELLNLLSKANPTIQKIVDRYEKNLITYLRLPTVPDNNIIPDIKHAPTLENPDEEIEKLASMYDIDHPIYSDMLQLTLSSSRFTNGITPQERKLIEKRYVFARDIKVLALAAELLDLNTQLHLTPGLESTLPSGIKIYIDETYQNLISDLANPHLWEKRTQLKDRVYTIYINGNSYLLKEKKTARHLHTKRHGHRDGNSSASELHIAKEFNQNIIPESENIALTWEKPIAYVEYPDGFQFTLFQFQENLISIDDIETKLRQTILLYRDVFKHEYESVVNILQEQQLISTKNGSSSKFKNILNIALQMLQKEKQPVFTFTYEAFALLKSLLLIKNAKRLMEKTIINAHYNNTDRDGYGFKIHISESTCVLEIIGFDFEYYEKISEAEKTRNLNIFEESEKKQASQGLAFLRFNDGNPVTNILNEAYKIMQSQQKK